MRNCLVAILFVFYTINSFSQTLMNKDSLLQLLPKAKEDVDKVLLLINIGQQYETNEPESAKKYYRAARKLSKEIDYAEGELKFVSNYGYVLNMQGQYDSTLVLNLQALKLARKLNNQEYIAKTLFNTGSSYSLKEDYEMAINYYSEGYALIEKTGNKPLIGQSLDILQNLYTGLRQYRKSADLGVKAVQIFRETNDSIQLGTALSNLGINYSKLSLTDSAINCFNEALAISKNIGDKNIECVQYLNLGDTFIQKNQVSQIKPYMEKALKISKELELNESEAIAYNGLSYYHFFARNYPLALAYADSSLQVVNHYNLREQKQIVFVHLSNLAFAMQDIPLGEEYARKSNILQDSLVNETIQKNVIDIEKKYEAEKKDAQIKLQQVSIKQKNTLNYIFIGSTAALLLLSFLAYRNYQHKKKLQQQRIQELETEKQLLATQSLIKGQEDERSRLAKDLHDGLGGLLSGVKLQLGAMKGNLILTEEHGRTFNNALNKLDESISEMRRVAHNMMPEALMKLGLQEALQDYFDGLSESQPFTIKTTFFGLEKRMEPSVEIVVYRIVQELLNNAVKHSGATTILAQIMRQDNHLTITVEDNGKGFDTAQINEMRTNGLRNIQSRVNFLNGQIDIQSNLGKGTSVHIDCNIEGNG